ncbi:MAG: TRAP transporter substrate-binding protein DctP [Chloroflexi bacterium]|nr:TRAP transporter substrate-binding protein DctP [Chloroflexota bacterium]
MVTMLACKAPQTTPAPAPTVTKTATATATVTAPPTTVTAKPAPAPTVTATATATVTTTPETVVTVKMLRPFPLDNILAIPHRWLTNEGNKMGEGKLVFKDVGGTEVAPAANQLKMVMAGTVEMTVNVTAYVASDFYEGVPLDGGIMGVMGPDIRKVGMLDALDRMARKKIGVAILGSPGLFPMSIFLNKPITKLADLKSMKLRSVPAYDIFFKAYGVPTVVIPAAEVIGALQTGVVDGMAWGGGTLGLAEFGFVPYLKYQVFPDMWKAPGYLSYVNAAWFDKLPDWHKNKLKAIMMAQENAVIDEVLKASGPALKKLREAGIKAITIPDQDWWDAQKIIFEETNKDLRKNAPDNAEEIIKYLSMFYPPKEIWWPSYEWK